MKNDVGTRKEWDIVDGGFGLRETRVGGWVGQSEWIRYTMYNIVVAGKTNNCSDQVIDNGSVVAK